MQRKQRSCDKGVHIRKCDACEQGCGIAAGAGGG
jgi:hypothetical protein